MLQCHEKNFQCAQSKHESEGITKILHWVRSGLSFGCMTKYSGWVPKMLIKAWFTSQFYTSADLVSVFVFMALKSEVNHIGVRNKSGRLRFLQQTLVCVCVFVHVFNLPINTCSACRTHRLYLFCFLPLFFSQHAVLLAQCCCG